MAVLFDYEILRHDMHVLHGFKPSNFCISYPRTPWSPESWRFSWDLGRLGGVFVDFVGSCSDTRLMIHVIYSLGSYYIATSC